MLYPEIAEKMTSIIMEYWESNAGFSSVDIVLDAFKAYLRGQYISNISAVNKKQKVRIQELQMQIEFQKEKYGQDSSCTNFDLMMAAQRDLHLHMEEITRLELYRNRKNIFEQGDKSGIFLARLAQQEYQTTTISEIETLKGQSKRT